MKKSRVLYTAMAILVTASLFGGCRGRGKSAKGGSFGDGSDISGVMGSAVDEDYLAARPGDGFTEYGSGRFMPVLFSYDSAEIQPSERSKIESVADELQANAASGVIVEGHCDERGSREYNLALGERRALAARAYLISLGVEASRVQTKSMGEEQPAAMGHDEGAWSQNRRAEFILFQ